MHNAVKINFFRGNTKLSQLYWMAPSVEHMQNVLLREELVRWAAGDAEFRASMHAVEFPEDVASGVYEYGVKRVNRRAGQTHHMWRSVGARRPMCEMFDGVGDLGENVLNVRRLNK